MKYSLAAFNYLSGKRWVASLEKYSVATFYYLGGKGRVAALEKYSVAAFTTEIVKCCQITSQEQPPLSYHRDSKMLPHCTSQEQSPLSYH
jgi:hypothetical protein